jgi:hypothetical protein
MCEIDPDTAPAVELAALDGVELAVAAVIDAKCNRTFGEAPVAETRTLEYRNPSVTYYTDRVYIPESGLYFFGDFWNTSGDIFVSSAGLRNVTGIKAGGTWDGTVWDDEYTFDPEDWQLTFYRSDGWYQGIDIISYRYANIRVTAEWEDRSASATIPADIKEAANFITADEWRIRSMSPAGELGPQGLSMYLRNAWEYELVKSAIHNNMYRPLIV